MKSEPSIHYRKSVRLKDFDYSQVGGYFITIVSFHRENIFGGVFNGEMFINSLGNIIHEEWFRSAQIRTGIRLNEDEFVIMPNHIHGIIWIDLPTVGARRVSPLPLSLSSPLHGKPNFSPHGFTPGSIGSIVASIKSSVTRRAGRELNTSNIWQRNYHEHIIRDNPDYERIAFYIFSNPSIWDQDEENL